VDLLARSAVLRTDRQGRGRANDEAGFASHQQTDHFKSLIVGQALPKLARRERTQHRFV
jgi:hypothetical protein